jgi:hypothetical protein
MKVNVTDAQWEQEKADLEQRLEEATVLLRDTYASLQLKGTNLGARYDALLSGAPARDVDDTDNPDYCRGYTDGVNAGVTEVLQGQQRDDKLATAIIGIEHQLDWHQRAESAESKLAEAERDLAETKSALDSCRVANGVLRDDLAETKAALDQALARRGDANG